MNKFLLLSSILLTGCFKVGPDYIKPEIATPTHWRNNETDALLVNNENKIPLKNTKHFNKSRS